MVDENLTNQDIEGKISFIANELERASSIQKAFDDWEMKVSKTRIGGI